jgi:hypothetical protein
VTTTPQANWYQLRTNYVCSKKKNLEGKVDFVEFQKKNAKLEPLEGLGAQA